MFSLWNIQQPKNALSFMCSSPSITSKTQQWQSSRLLKASAASNNLSPQVIHQKHYHLKPAFLFCLTLPYLSVQFLSWQHSAPPTTNPIPCRLRKSQRIQKPRTRDASTNKFSYPTCWHNRGRHLAATGIWDITPLWKETPQHMGDHKHYFLA